MSAARATLFPKGEELPSSALGQDAPKCSVRPDHREHWCSVGNSSTSKKCTVECDGGPQECSAFHSEGSEAFCSVAGDSSQGCSVLLPGANPPTGATMCSAGGGGQSVNNIKCSAKGDGSLQLCSVDEPTNRPQFANSCSAKNVAGAPNTVTCSVLRRGDGRGACSAFTHGNAKFCSVLDGNVKCSVATDRDGPVGKCTSLRFADDGTCSVQVAPESGNHSDGHCSVFDGSGAGQRQCGTHATDDDDKSDDDSKSNDDSHSGDGDSSSRGDDSSND